MLETYSYSASKAAVHQLTRHLAKRDWLPEITVNAIAPGPFESKMMAATLEAFGEQIAADAPLKRIGRPDDMAGAAIYLSSRAGAYLTGAVIPVDGGIATTRSTGRGPRRARPRGGGTRGHNSATIATTEAEEHDPDLSNSSPVERFEDEDWRRPSPRLWRMRRAEVGVITLLVGGLFGLVFLGAGASRAGLFAFGRRHCSA